MRKPGTVKYYVGRGKAKKLLEFSYVHGGNGFGGTDWDGEYYEFSNTADGTKLKISPKQLAPGEKERLDEEWHRAPYRDEVFNLKKIELRHADNYEEGRYRTDDGCEQVWLLDRVRHDTFVCEFADGAQLCILNNKPIEVRGTTFEAALRKLFPVMEVTLCIPTVIRRTLGPNPS